MRSLKQLQQPLSEEALTTLAEEVLAPTPLGDVARLLKEAMKLNLAPVQGLLGDGPRPLTERQMSVNDKLAEARNIVNALRGDGQ